MVFASTGRADVRTVGPVRRAINANVTPNAMSTEVVPGVNASAIMDGMANCVHSVGGLQHLFEPVWYIFTYKIKLCDV